MSVDVRTEVIINRPCADVAAYAGDPGNAPEWYTNIKSVSWQTSPPIKVGSKLDFVAQFLGRKMAYTYVIAEYVPGVRLVMRTTQGPFPMETTYTWEPVDRAHTQMTLRNRGEPTGFARIGSTVIALAMRRANQKDLANIKRILESGNPPAHV